MISLRLGDCVEVMKQIEDEKYFDITKERILNERN